MQTDDAPIYLDYNATTPLHQQVVDEMIPYLKTHFGNPSSSHFFGIQTKKAVENARQQVADMLECNVDEILFTSGGSESNNYAIKGLVQTLLNNNANQVPHIITSVIEHPAITEVCKYLTSHKLATVSYVGVDEQGIINLQAVKDAIIPGKTKLITVMHANNETGVVQPLRELAEIAHAVGALIHTDASQSVGKIETTIKSLQVDMLTVCSHKFYGPKGIGALYVKRGVTLEKQIHGANHEQDKRAGTENVLEVVGLGKACELVTKEWKQRSEQFKEMRDKLEKGIENQVPCKVNGHREKRLPNTLSISFPKIQANLLLSEVSKKIAASAGAACHSAIDIKISNVLAAMKVPIDVAMGTIRLSTGIYTTAKQIDEAITILVAAVKKLSPQQDSQAAVITNDEEIELTQTTSGLGCGCKIAPQVLEEVLKSMPKQPINPNVLVGTETADDASVYKLSDDLALVQTVDFFTPIVDDAKQFGAIACANSLSDVYAMGATPIQALNIVAFPSKRLPLSVLKNILLGAQEKANEAGVSILGGHTIDDPEPKFGMCVAGIVHPNKIWKNCSVQSGDVLILTKPLGVGILATAMKRKLVDNSTKEKLIETMATLNKYAFDVAKKYTVHACTDVTGFGLLGHLKEMAHGSGLGIVIHADKVPVLDHAFQFAIAQVIPGGTYNNHSYVDEFVTYAPEIILAQQMILCDAQTSGGLVFAVPASEADALVQELQQQPKGILCAAKIGHITHTTTKIAVQNTQ